MSVWLHAQRAAIALAFSRLWVAPVGSALALLAIGVVLALPAGTWLLVKNADRLVRGTAPATPELTLFLAVDAEPAATDAVVQRLSAHGGVRTYRRVTREETLARLQAEEGMREVLELLPNNPFSDAVIVVPRDESPQAIEALAAEARSWPRVEHVALDAGLARKLDALFRAGRIAAGLLAGLLALGLLAITFNTIRLQVLTARAEIEVARLLGASDTFIRRPFLWFGLLQGFCGGLLAWLATAGAASLLAEPLSELARLYGAEFVFMPLDAGETVALLACAMTVGWLGAALSLRQHLNAE